MIAMLIEDMLDELGYQVAVVAGRLQAALQALNAEAFEIAIVDVNIAGQPSYPVADRLMQGGIPFAFVTGYGVTGLAEAYRSIPVLQKPFRITDLARTIGQLRGAG